MRRYKIALIFYDTLLLNFSMIFSLLLKFEGQIPSTYLSSYIHTFWVLSLISITTFTLGTLYRSLWSYAGIKEILQVIICNIISIIFFYIYTILTDTTFPKSVYIIYSILSFFCVGGIRLSYRVARRIKYFFPGMLFSKQPTSRILLVGAGEAASIIITEYEEHFPTSKIVAAVDDAEYKQHTLINHVHVRGKIANIPEIVQKYGINHIIIAMPSAPKERIIEVISLCHTTSCKLDIFSGIQDAVGPSIFQHVRPVNIEDLLGRDEIHLDNTSLYEQLTGKTILVTGGGGSIGSELCRQLISYNPQKLIIFDIYENTTYELQNELLSSGVPSEQLEIIIGSVRDPNKLNQVFDLFNPHIVFHAAAHKHVPLMELNPSEAIKNNVYGTLNTALCAREHMTEKFILISTDKAVNPTNIMGASKRLCEMIIQALATTHCKTSFSAVRFGNVLGSHGSVIPLFKKQLEMGGPITVTHEDIIRYFMTIPEAVRLILQTTLLAKGGEIFILDMGNPVKIMDLAKNFIKLSGLTLGKDIDIKITGLRPGEKLFEELLMSEEGLQKTACNKIFIAHPMAIDYELLERSLLNLENYFYNEKALKLAIKKIVPTYQPNSLNESIINSSKELSAI